MVLGWNFPLHISWLFLFPPSFLKYREITACSAVVGLANRSAKVAQVFLGADVRNR